MAELRTGWTTGCCAALAAKAATQALFGGRFPNRISIRLPQGQQPCFPPTAMKTGDGWAECGVIKDAGDDPDVTHGALIMARVERGASGSGVAFRAGVGVGVVTRRGLPLPVGEPAINPAPRRMIAQTVAQVCRVHDAPADLIVTISVPGGEELARRTWNARLGVVGGLSILGTTGIVRPFSCAAWIASIHQGVDVARAEGLSHVIAATGATSEATARARHGLPTGACLDMGDFVGGTLKYLRRHPIERLTLAGGVAKFAKLAMGALDLHSKRSPVDFARLQNWLHERGLSDVGGAAQIADANTVLEAYQRLGPPFARLVAIEAKGKALEVLRGAPVEVELMLVDRAGEVAAIEGFG